MRNAFCSQEGPIRELSCIESFLVLNRLSRLLHKQKFDEALRFAKQFNLDIEVRFYIKDVTYLLWFASREGQTILA